MTLRTVATLLAGAPALALSEDHAAACLAQALPDGAAAGQGAGPTAGPEVERFAIARGVAVVPVRGLLTANNAMLERWMGWTTYFGLIDTLAGLSANADVAAIVLEIDSPGGMVLGLEDAAAAVAAAAAVKPVHALANPLCASAAYWLASQATEISATAGTVLGSIGIATLAEAYVGPGSSGAQVYALTSAHARAKRPDPATPEGRAEIQRSLDQLEARFHAAVAAGRGIAPEALAARLSVSDDPRDGGATFLAAEAVTRGLADRVETAAAFSQRIFGQYAPKPRVTPARGYRAQAAAALARASG